MGFLLGHKKHMDEKVKFHPKKPVLLATLLSTQFKLSHLPNRRPVLFRILTILKFFKSWKPKEENWCGPGFTLLSLRQERFAFSPLQNTNFPPLSKNSLHTCNVGSFLYLSLKQTWCKPFFPINQPNICFFYIIKHYFTWAGRDGGLEVLTRLEGYEETRLVW